jgi:hypothetical protein
MDDKKLKDMWNKAEIYLGTSGYEASTIEGFLSGRSGAGSEKIRKMIQLHIVIKVLAAVILLLDAVLYYPVQPMVSYICILGAIIVIPLIWYELKILNRFSRITDNNRSPKEKLSDMLVFLRSHSFTTLLSISSTYLFGYTAGILLYFFVAYGYLRRMGSLDIFVFPAICIFGMILNYVMNNNTIKYQIKHFEACLADLDKDVLKLVSSNIDEQQKRSKTTKLLIGIIVFLSFLIFVAVLKELGF